MNMRAQIWECVTDRITLRLDIHKEIGTKIGDVWLQGLDNYGVLMLYHNQQHPPGLLTMLNIGGFLFIGLLFCHERQP